MNETEAVAKAPAHPQTLGRTAWLALTVLSSLNLLNYADRYVISSLLPTLQKPVEEGGLALTDGESGWLYSAFILVYTPTKFWQSPLMKSLNGQATSGSTAKRIAIWTKVIKSKERGSSPKKNCLSPNISDKT